MESDRRPVLSLHVGGRVTLDKSGVQLQSDVGFAWHVAWLQRQGRGVTMAVLVQHGGQESLVATESGMYQSRRSCSASSRGAMGCPGTLTRVSLAPEGCWRKLGGP